MGTRAANKWHIHYKGPGKSWHHCPEPRKRFSWKHNDKVERPPSLGASNLNNFLKPNQNFEDHSWTSLLDRIKPILTMPVSFWTLYSKLNNSRGGYAFSH